MITLFLGGAASGKSEMAERYTASRAEPITYVATWVPDGADPGMDARIAAHRDRRPPSWALVEVRDDLPGQLRRIRGTALLDALGTWVACAPDMQVDGAALCAALTERDGDTVVVSDEVGFGVHPSTALGGRFREVLGRINAAVAAVADEAWLVVAGRALRLDPSPW